MLRVITNLILILVVIPFNLASAAAKDKMNVVKVLPFQQLLADKEKTAWILNQGEASFAGSISIDVETGKDGRIFIRYFQLKQVGNDAPPEAWRDKDLNAGVTFKYSGGELALKSNDTAISITDTDGRQTEVSWEELSNLLYEESSKVSYTDDGLYTFAIIRNISPVSGEKGILTMRKSSDEGYRYNIIPDKQGRDEPVGRLSDEGSTLYLRVTRKEVIAFIKSSKKFKLTAPKNPNDQESVPTDPEPAPVDE